MRQRPAVPERGLDPPSQGAARRAVRAHGGAENNDVVETRRVLDQMPPPLAPARASCSNAYCQATISFFISAIAFAGLRPLGQVFVQFMIVWQR